MHAHCILPNCPESPIGNWEKIRHAPQRAAQPALVSMCVPHTIRVYSCLVLSPHALLVISAAANAIVRNIVRGAANFIFSSLRIQVVTANISADQLSQTPRARAEIRPAMRHDRRRIFPMDSPQSRASLRVIKPSPKLNRRLQPKIKSAKAAKNNYSNFAATAVLAVAGILLALSLSHLAAGIALVTGAGPFDGWLMAIGIDLGFIALNDRQLHRRAELPGDDEA